MKILVTCPGKFGDLLWAMATARAIAESYGERVDVMTSASYGSIVPLLRQQPYIHDAGFFVNWVVQDTAPMTPREPPDYSNVKQYGYDRIFHLGYDGWPQHPLPLEHWRLAVAQKEWYAGDPPLKDVELGRAWITGAVTEPARDVVAGFTDEHFELKSGLLHLLERPPGWNLSGRVVTAPETRWATENYGQPCTWEEAASWIRGARVFLGCCSALHVLAVAVGTPVVLMEPNPHRHNDVFYPLGKVGPQVTLVTGNDGQPTFDARHVADAVESALARVRSEEAPRV